ncbi:hypothetical protein A9P82_12225 [Arachidicoccus ginsenosidimutans]|nr:hypothetical protein A9P82_12225 [Arachidicoccus sp. BS20]
MVNAQKTTGSLSGTLVDTSRIDTSSGLSQATVSLVDAKDTTKVLRTLSDNQGKFSFHGLAPDVYMLRVSYLGYQPINKFIGITQVKPNIDLGNVNMEQIYNDNGTVIINASVPASLKGDTTSYSAASYGTKPNATVEDLLGKLPGVEVDKNGVITAQGEQVTRVFVDGKRFFGNDPKLAIENLPKDIVEKIEIFDGKSDQSELSGFDDGITIKTINIVTKPSRKFGWFGRSALGAGNDEATLKDPLYTLNARVFHFDGDVKMGLVGEMNNVNVQGFTRADQNNQNGLTKTGSGNAFFGNTWNGKKAKTDFSVDYHYNNTNVKLLQNSIRQNFYSDSALNNNNLGLDTSNTLTQNHSINLNLDTKFDSTDELRIRPSISFNSSNKSTQSSTEIDSLSGGESIPKNITYADRTNHNSGHNINVSATYAHSFAKKGRRITLDMQYSNGESSNGGNNYSRMQFFGIAPDDVTNQRNETDGNNNSLSSTLTYTEPIAQNQQLELQYNNSFSTYTSNRKTFDFDSSTNDYSIPNIELTNDFKNNFSSNNAVIGYRYNNGIINFNLSGGVKFGKKEGNNLSKDYTIVDNYTNLYPTARLTYNISRTKKLIFRYEGRTNQPAIAQLQPIVDSSNVLNITSGNPNLKQNFNNHFQFRYNDVNNSGKKFFFVFLDANFIHNNIVNSITHLENGGQSTMPVNLDGSYNLHGSLDYGLPLMSPKSNFDFKTDVRNNRSASLIDSSMNFTYNTALSESIRWSTSMDKLFDINVAITPAYNIATYGDISDDDNLNYYSQSTSFDGTWYAASGWEITSSFDYTFYNGNAPGQNVSIPLWNAGIIKHLFKDNAGEISISVHDILNENKGVNFQRSENYSQQTMTNILKRYALISFTYNLHKFGVKRSKDALKDWKKRYENDKESEDEGS